MLLGNLKMLRVIFSVPKRYAGHSKWANIKHIKGVKDAQRAVLFAKLARQMKVAIQEGKSTNPSANIYLEQAIQQAKRASMPVASIQNVLKSSQVSKTDSKKYILEIRGPGGCFILLEVFTENFTKCKQTLATALRKGSSQYTTDAKHLFECKGLIDCEVLPSLKEEDPSKLLEITTEHAILAGAEDVEILDAEDEKVVRFLCDPQRLHQTAGVLEKEFKYTLLSKSTEYIPNSTVTLNENDQAILDKLVEKLENDPDVINLYSNVD